MPFLQCCRGFYRGLTAPGQDVTKLHPCLQCGRGIHHGLTAFAYKLEQERVFLQYGRGINRGLTNVAPSFLVHGLLPSMWPRHSLRIKHLGNREDITVYWILQCSLGVHRGLVALQFRI